MKYFIFLTIIIFAVTCKLATDNNNSLSSVERIDSSIKDESSYQKIDLSKITIRGFGEKAELESGNQSEERGPVQPEPVGELVEIEESESTLQMQEARYAKDSDEKYRPETDEDNSKNTIELMKKKFNQKNSK